MFATEDECPSLNKPHYVTYPDGACILAKTDTIEKTRPQGKPFIDETHLYLDDTLLGLTLWNNGYRVTYVPVRARLHYANMTTRPILSYYDIRGIITAIEIVSTRYSTYKLLYYLRRDLGNKVLATSAERDIAEYMKPI